MKTSRRVGPCCLCAAHTTYEYNIIEESDGTEIQREEDLSIKIKSRGFHFICKRFKAESPPSSWVKDQIFCSTCTKILTDIHQLLFSMEVLNMKLEGKVQDVKERAVQIEKEYQSKSTRRNKKTRNVSKPSASNFCSQIASFAKRPLNPIVNLTKLASQSRLSDNEISCSKSTVIPRTESQFVEENGSISLPPISPSENTDDYRIIDYLDVKSEDKDWFDSQMDFESESSSIENVDTTRQPICSRVKTRNTDLGLKPCIKLTRINSLAKNVETNRLVDDDKPFTEEESENVKESPYTGFDIQPSTLDSDEDDAISNSDPLYIPDNFDEQSSDDDCRSPISFQKKDRIITITEKHHALKPLRTLRPKPVRSLDPSSTLPSPTGRNNISTKAVIQPLSTTTIPTPSSLTTSSLPTRLLINNEGRIAISRIYRCDYCEVTFTDKLLVVGHYEQLHAEKPKFQCTNCKRKFFLSSDLKLHINWDHSLNETTTVLGTIPGIPGIQPLNISSSVKPQAAQTQTIFIPQINLLNNIIQEPNALAEQLPIKRKQLDDDELMKKLQDDIHKKELVLKSKKRPCSLCSKILDSPFALKYHLLSAHETEDKPHQCDKCPEKFTQKINLDDHVKKNHSRKELFSCKICSCKCPSEKRLFEHLALIHNDKEKQKAITQKVYSCKKCEKKFVTVPNLRRHILRSHTENCCEFCGKNFKSLVKFQEHLVSYHSKDNGSSETEEYAYKCTECGKGYMNEQTLRYHIEKVHLKTKHAATKNWICEVCGKAYATENLLKYHNLKVHDESLRKTMIKCPHCPKKVPKMSYQSHVKRHSILIRRKPCDICGKVMTINALKYHNKRNFCHRRLARKPTPDMPQPPAHAAPTPLSPGTSENLEKIEMEDSTSGNNAVTKSMDITEPPKQTTPSPTHSVPLSLGTSGNLEVNKNEKNSTFDDAIIPKTVENTEQPTSSVDGSDHDNFTVKKLALVQPSPLKARKKKTSKSKGIKHISSSSKNYKRGRKELVKPPDHDIPFPAEDENYCRLCGHSYKSKIEARNHFKERHDGHRPYKCHHSPCEHSTWYRQDMQKHIYFLHMSEEERQPFKTLACSFCDKKFAYFFHTGFKYHITAHTKASSKVAKKMNGECQRVNKSSSSTSTNQLLSQEPTVPFAAEDEIKCRLCGHFYKSKASKVEARNHFKEKHDGHRPFKCPHSPCESSVWHRQDMQKHIYYLHMNEEEKKQFQTLACSLCDKKFFIFNTSGLKLHIMSHNNERPFPCPNCKCAFQRPQTLKKHMDTCQNREREGEHLCHLCNSKFVEKYSLKQHIEKQHTGEYKCHICFKQRRTKDEMEKHFKFHKFRFEWIEPNEVQAEELQSDNLKVQNQNMDTS